MPVTFRLMLAESRTAPWLWRPTYFSCLTHKTKSKILKHLRALYLHDLDVLEHNQHEPAKALSRQLIPAPVRFQRVYSTAGLDRWLTGALIFARLAFLANIETTNSCSVRSIVSRACSKCLHTGLSFCNQKISNCCCWDEWYNGTKPVLIRVANSLWKNWM